MKCLLNKKIHLLHSHGKTNFWEKQSQLSMSIFSNFTQSLKSSNLVLIHVTPLKILFDRLPTVPVLLIFRECRFWIRFFFVLLSGLNSVNHWFLFNYSSPHLLVFSPNCSSGVRYILILLCSDLGY